MLMQVALLHHQATTEIRSILRSVSKAFKQTVFTDAYFIILHLYIDRFYVYAYIHIFVYVYIYVSEV